MGKLLSLDEKTARAVRVANRLGVDVRQTIVLEPGRPFFLPYKFGLMGGLSEPASDEYEQQIAAHLIKAGRSDLVVTNDDGSQRVLPLMRFNYDTDQIAEYEKGVPTDPDSMKALYDTFERGKLTAVMMDCDAVALACNTHQFFMAASAQAYGMFQVGAASYICPTTEIDVIDISAPVLQKLDELGVKEGDVALLLGTTLTNTTGLYWSVMLAHKGIKTGRLPADAQKLVNDVAYDELGWKARAAFNAAAGSDDEAAIKDFVDGLHQDWVKILQDYTQPTPKGTAAVVIEACTDFVYPFSASREGRVPGTNVPVLNTMELHTAAIAKQIATDAPLFTPEMREQFAAHPPYKAMFIGSPEGPNGFAPKDFAPNREDVADRQASTPPGMANDS